VKGSLAFNHTKSIIIADMGKNKEVCSA